MLNVVEAVEDRAKQIGQVGRWDGMAVQVGAGDSRGKHKHISLVRLFAHRRILLCRILRFVETTHGVVVVAEWTRLLKAICAGSLPT
jgi:hypothetical protein